MGEGRLQDFKVEDEAGLLQPLDSIDYSASPLFLSGGHPPLVADIRAPLPLDLPRGHIPYSCQVGIPLCSCHRSLSPLTPVTWAHIPLSLSRGYISTCPCHVRPYPLVPVTRALSLVPVTFTLGSLSVTLALFLVPVTWALPLSLSRGHSSLFLSREHSYCPCHKCSTQSPPACKRLGVRSRRDRVRQRGRHEAGGWRGGAESGAPQGVAPGLRGRRREPPHQDGAGRVRVRPARPHLQEGVRAPERPCRRCL